MKQISVCLVFVMRLERGRVDHWWSRHKLVFDRLISLGNDLLLTLGQREDLAFFFWGHLLERSSFSLNFRDEQRKDSVFLVVHLSSSDAIKGALEDLSVSLLVVHDLVDSLLVGVKSNLLELGQVVLLELCDVVEHDNGSIVEVLLEVESLVDEVVHEGSLLDVSVLLVDSAVLDLSLCLNNVLVAVKLSSVLPLVEELIGLVVREHIVEDGKLRSGDQSEVTDLSVADDEGHQELLMEHESSEPFVIVDSSKSSNHLDSGEVSEHEDEPSS